VDANHFRIYFRAHFRNVTLVNKLSTGHTRAAWVNPDAISHRLPAEGMVGKQ
jgi:hypothetical protein